MSKYGLHGKLQSKTGSSGKLTQILLEASKLVSTAKGCRLYLISKDKINNDSIWVTEVWDSKEDHDNSLNAESVKALISQAMPLIDGRPERGQELEILGGKGID
jgi:quinol monooxygenase YgiN